MAHPNLHHAAGRPWWRPWGQPAQEAPEPPKPVDDTCTVVLAGGREVRNVTPTAFAAWSLLSRHAELEQIEGFPSDEDGVVTEARRLLLSH